MKASYHGFSLEVSRAEKCPHCNLRGWTARVFMDDAQISDDVAGPWISATEAQNRAVLIARQEIVKSGKPEPTDAPKWNQ